MSDLRRVSQYGINIIKESEAYSSIPYKDSGGLWTIGWGHLIKPNEHFESITEEEAESLLRSDLKNAENCVNQYVTVPINQNQFDALVSFVFNDGVNNFKNSTLLKILNSNQTT